MVCGGQWYVEVSGMRGQWYVVVSAMWGQWYGILAMVKDVSEWCMRSLVCKVKEVSSILKFKEKHMIQT